MKTPNNSDQTISEQTAESGSSIQSSTEEIEIGSATTLDQPTFGWSAYAERVNGRFAMIGLMAVLLVEALSKISFLEWAGILSKS